MTTRTVKYISRTPEGRRFEDELARVGPTWDWADKLYEAALEAESDVRNNCGSCGNPANVRPLCGPCAEEDRLEWAEEDR